MNLSLVYQRQRQEIVKKPIGYTCDAKPMISLLATLHQRMAPADAGTQAASRQVMLFRFMCVISQAGPPTIRRYRKLIRVFCSKSGPCATLSTLKVRPSSNTPRAIIWRTTMDSVPSLRAVCL